MILQETKFRPTKRQMQLVVGRLYDQTTGGTRRTISFHVLCTAVGIPLDAQAALLQALIAEGYVTREEDDEICLTRTGTKMATSPLS